jgi:hypothetical protein
MRAGKRRLRTRPVDTSRKAGQSREHRMTRNRHMSPGMRYVTKPASRNVMRRLVAARSAPGTGVLLTVIPPTIKSGREIWLVDAAATIPLPSPRESS